jgi:hypothetical protein
VRGLGVEFFWRGFFKGHNEREDGKSGLRPWKIVNRSQTPDNTDHRPPVAPSASTTRSPQLSSNRLGTSAGARRACWGVGCSQCHRVRRAHVQPGTLPWCRRPLDALLRTSLAVAGAVLAEAGGISLTQIFALADCRLGLHVECNPSAQRHGGHLSGCVRHAPTGTCWRLGQTVPA